MLPKKIVPDYILGDFDSIKGEVIEYYRSQNVAPIKEYKPEKDATDTAIGLELAMKIGSDRIFMLGATGGRLDHFVGNMQSLMIPAMEQKEAWILDSQNAMTVLWESRTLWKKEAFGKYVSFLSMTEKTTGIVLKGFKYPLNGYDMTFMDGIGISNEITEETATVEFTKGMLLMVMSKDKEQTA